VTLIGTGRFLHRRRAAGARVQISRAAPHRILVVCHGNLCRSPYLEARLRSSIPEVEFRSAGFVGSGRPAPATAVSVASARGLELSAHRSKPITQLHVDWAEVVVVMDASQASEIARAFRVKRGRILIAGDLDPDPSAKRGIEDPLNGSAEQYEASFSRLDRCAEELVRILRRTF
jgi:protein-tyrosine phosphatase